MITKSLHYGFDRLKMFMENVEVNGKKMPRFEYIGD